MARNKFMNEYIIGIDHGNGNIKTANTIFPCGYTAQRIAPAKIFAEDVICYNGEYYVLNANRFPYCIDKTKNENAFILTLFAIAKEVCSKSNILGAKEFMDKEIILAIGLPPAHFEMMHERFKDYFIKRMKENVSFTYNGIPFSFKVKDIRVYPQDYAAAIIFRQELITRYSSVYCIDIGDGTVDLLGLREGIPDKDIMLSREMGMAKLREKIIDDVINDYAYTLDGKIIEDVLSPGKSTILDYEITERIRKETQEWASRIISQLSVKVSDFRIAPTIFSGGGALLLKPYLIRNGSFGRAEFIDDIHANAIGYEEIAKIEYGRG